MCPRWSGTYDAYPYSERPGFNPPLRHRIFQITNCHLLDHCYIWWPIGPLLYLVANWTHCYIWWPIGPTVIFGGQCDLQVQNTSVHAFSFEDWVWQQSGVLGGLAVMMLTQIVRNQGLIPCWGTEFLGSLLRPIVTLKPQEYLNTRFVPNLCGK